MRSRIASESAASPCISPSISKSGAARTIKSSALPTLEAVGASSVPKFECDNSATFGVNPKRRTSSAAISVISAICAGEGFSLT